MMLAVVGYPDLDADDRHWIESFRAAHDPQAGRVSVHFTLVFPLEASLEEVEAETSTASTITAPIKFEIDRADVVPDALGNGSHVMLLPGEGSTQMAALHDLLYGGVLRPHLRRDIPYVPHLTVAVAPDSAMAQRASAELGLHNRIVRGTVDALDIVDVSGTRVRSLATYPLRAGA